MKIPISYFLVLFFTMPTVVLRAQTTKMQEPKFSLTISMFQPGGSENPSFHDLRVVETNTSSEAIFEDGCLETRGIFRISILYNGRPLQERDEVARKRRDADARSGRCRAMASMIDPGQSWERYVALSWDYPMTEPGTYEITVSRESDLDYPEKSVSVRSNTITIVVPQPKAAAPK